MRHPVDGPRQAALVANAPQVPPAAGAREEVGALGLVGARTGGRVGPGTAPRPPVAPAPPLAVLGAAPPTRPADGARALAPRQGRAAAHGVATRPAPLRPEAVPPPDRAMGPRTAAAAGRVDGAGAEVAVGDRKARAFVGGPVAGAVGLTAGVAPHTVPPRTVVAGLAVPNHVPPLADTKGVMGAVRPPTSRARAVLTATGPERVAEVPRDHAY